MKVPGSETRKTVPPREWGEVNLERLGSEYGGWVIPQEFITKDSIVYSAGVGEDISFDLTLMNKYGCEVQAFDPTPRAITFVKTAVPSGMRFRFHAVGLWNTDTEIHFFPPEDPSHVSHSIGNLQKTEGGFLATVKRLSTLMRELGHPRIDLLKMDIEGAEYQVIDSIIEDALDVTVLCVEFHEVTDGSDSAEQATKRLEAFGYTLAYIESKNFTFLRTGGDRQALLEI